MEKRQLPPRRAKILSPRMKGDLLAVLIRNREAFQTVRDTLGPNHWKAVGLPHMLIWQETLRFFAEHGDLPSRELLMTEIDQRLDETPSLLTDEQLQTVDKLMALAFDDLTKEKAAESIKHADWAIRKARSLLAEVVAQDAQQAIFDGGERPADLSDFFSRCLDQSQKIQSMGVHGSTLPFPDGWDNCMRGEARKTGMPWDRFTGGGERPGEVTALLAPTGTMKTVAAIDSWVMGCKMAAIEWDERGRDGKKGVSLLCFYEGSLSEMRERALANAASVPRKRLAAISSIDDLENEAVLDYEKRVFKKQLASGTPITHERGRVIAATRLLNECGIMFDFTGEDPRNPGLGSGGVNEMCSHILSFFRNHPEFYCYRIIVDHVMAMVDQQFGSTGNADWSNLRHELRTIPLTISNRLAKALHCPVLILSQLSADAGKRSPAAKYSHYDHPEGRAFAMALPYCIVGGTLTNRSLAVLHCSKHRHDPPRDNMVIRVDGSYSRLLDYSKFYYADEATRRIVSHQEKATVANPSELLGGVFGGYNRESNY